MPNVAIVPEHLAALCPVERSRMDAERQAIERKAEQERQRVEAEKEAAQRRQDRHDKREHVIQELVQTEKDYISSLSLIYETFLGPNATKVKSYMS